MFNTMNITMGTASLIVVLIFSGWINTATGKVPREDMFPFGIDAGDSLLHKYLPNDTDTKVPFRLVDKFDFFNTPYSDIYICSHGNVSFDLGMSFEDFSPQCSSTGIPMISVFWAVSDTSNNTIGGAVYYRETTDLTLRLKALSEIKKTFPLLQIDSVGWLFIVTWHNIPFLGAAKPDPETGCRGEELRNTYQMTLATDGYHSFAILFYNEINWTTGTLSGGDSCTGLGGTAAKVGFDDGANQFFDAPGSCTASVRHLTGKSNQGPSFPGRWVFRVDNNISPGECTDLVKINRIEPAFVSLNGHQLITLSGPCEKYPALKCTFHDYIAKPTVASAFRTDDSFTCRVPYGFSRGQIPLELSVGYESSDPDSVVKFPGHIYTTAPENNVRFRIVDNTLGIIRVEWDATYFRGKLDPLLYSIQINVIEFDPYKFEWINRGMIHSLSAYDNGIAVGLFEGIPHIPRALASVQHTFFIEVEATPLEKHENRDFLMPQLQSKFLHTNYLKSTTYFDTQCDNWYAADKGPPQGLSPCPPTLALANIDENFVRDDYDNNFEDLGFFHPGVEQSFRQRVRTWNGHGQHCVYKGGKLLSDTMSRATADWSSPYGSLGAINHQTNDVRPWFICCKYSSNPAVRCNQYYSKRPSDSGEKYEPPHPGYGTGDPHINTYDRLYYSYNGVGEYWIVNTSVPTNNKWSLSVQGRMEQWIPSYAGPQPASVFRGFAFLQTNVTDGTKTYLQLTLEERTTTRLTYILDGAHLPMPSSGKEMTFTKDGISLTVDSNGNSIIAFATGFTFRIAADYRNSYLNMWTSVQMSQKSGAKVVGMMGNCDGNPMNDLTDPNGRVIDWTTATQETIYYDFGMKWRTRAEESIFTYLGGKSHSSYYWDSWMPNLYLDLKFVPKEILDLCGGSEACLFDYINSGGDIEFARNAKQYNDQLTDMRDILCAERPTEGCCGLRGVKEGQVHPAPVPLDIGAGQVIWSKEAFGYGARAEGRNSMYVTPVVEDGFLNIVTKPRFSRYTIETGLNSMNVPLSFSCIGGQKKLYTVVIRVFG